MTVLSFVDDARASVSWEEPLHPQDVRAYLKARTALVSTNSVMSSPSLQDERAQWRDTVLLRYGLNAREFEYLQARIERAHEMLQRYETLLGRQAERVGHVVALLESNYLSDWQKTMMLRVTAELYALEMERIGKTRRDWSALAPYLDQLDRIVPPSYVGSV